MQTTIYRNVKPGDCIGSWPLDDGKTVSVVDIAVYVDGKEVDRSLSVSVLGKYDIQMGEMDFLFTLIRYTGERNHGLKLLLYDEENTVPDGMEIHLTVVSQSMKDFVRINK